MIINPIHDSFYDLAQRTVFNITKGVTLDMRDYKNSDIFMKFTPRHMPRSFLPTQKEFTRLLQRQGIYYHSSSFSSVIVCTN